MERVRFIGRTDKPVAVRPQSLPEIRHGMDLRLSVGSRK